LPPIEHAEFLERFMPLLDAAGAGGTAQEKGLAPPMAALDMPAQSFADVYGGDGNLLVTMAAQARDCDDPGMASLLTELDWVLRDGTLDIKASPESAPRLTQYVYPVV
jgi:hypothetical protein